jgi:predicted P-loop ATPase
MDDNVANHQVLVLVGPQGIYKTSWLFKLLPEPLRMYQNNLVLNGMGKVDDDVRNMLYENAIVNLDELDAMGTSEINQIKSLITCQVITNRAKYHRFKQTHMRIASLCGSTNKTHFLTDLTGSRRWMPFEVSAIVNPYENIFPLDRMYAQAYHLYRSGLEYWMTPEDNAVLNQHNEDFRVQDSMEELLHLWFDIPAQNCGTFMTSAEIGDFLINQGSIKRPMSSQALSILLKKAGFQPTRKKINGNQIRGFLVYKRERDEVDRIKRDIVTSAHPSDIPTN